MLPAVEEPPTQGTFAPHTGTTFAVPIDGDEPVVLTLAEVEPLPAYDENVLTKPFRLTFEGPADRMLIQATHRMEHDKLGELAIFMVPIAPGRYEAVFS